MLVGRLYTVLSYLEGNFVRGKVLTSGGGGNENFKTSKPHACDPGYTQADLPGSGSPGFCLFYARGCCGFGHKCRSWDDLQVFWRWDGWVNGNELMMDHGFGGVKCEETAHKWSSELI